MNTAIIVAAGRGERFNSEVPKQFLELKGKPVIVHAIEHISAAPSIDSIVLVLAQEWISKFERLKAEYPKLSSIVTGGRTRAESVQNGLNSLRECEIVAIHDGARPLVSVDEIERVVAKAMDTGAACLVAPVTDTIKSISGGEIAATLDRDKLRRALTPQAFRFDVIKRAFEHGGLNPAVTDDSYLIERLGHPVALVDGSRTNIKITHREDLILAEALLQAGSGART